MAFSMKVYHGTTPENWAQIQQEGLKAGSFASEQALALSWRGADTVVLEAELSDKLIATGVRGEPGLACAQYGLAEGAVILPHELRRVPDKELEADREYLMSLGKR